MKSFLLLVVMLIVFISAMAQKPDSLCCLRVERSLHIIKQYLKNKNSDNSVRRIGAISFLSDLSGIPSESDGSYIGQLNPTLKDYTRWQSWYIKNKHKISCDKIKNFEF